MKISVILALSFLVPAPGVDIACPSSILQQCDPLTYEDFRNIAQYHCYNPSIAWRRLVFQETSRICHGNCDSIVISNPLRNIDGVEEECGQHTCRRIHDVIEESCNIDEPSAMDAYDVAYRVSYMAPRPVKRLFQRRLGAAPTTGGCQDSKTSFYYSIAIGICSGLLTTAILLWLYVFHTHLEDRRRRLRQTLQMRSDDSTSSKTSVAASSDDFDSVDAVPPTPPELYDTSVLRPAPAMIGRSASRPRSAGVAVLLDTMMENKTKVVALNTSRNGSLTMSSEDGADAISPRGVESYHFPACTSVLDGTNSIDSQPTEDIETTNNTAVEP